MIDQAIKVENLSKNFKVHLKKEGLWESVKSLFVRKYKTIKAVDDISFEIKQGEIVGFIGPNGAGKTTTLKMLSGLLYPSSGFVEVLGYTPFKRKEDFLKQISLVMGQKNQLWWDLPAIETFSLNKEIYEIPKDKYKRIMAELVEMLELGDIINQQVRKLSLGQRMKCELVASLLHSPKVLFLDEPTIGLDVVMQKRIREFIKEYNQKYNASIMLTSHYMDDVKEICKRIIIINKGRIFYDGDIDELIHKYADYKLLIPIFNQKFDKDKLAEYGEVLESDAHRAIIKVERSKSSQAASKLLSSYDIDDLNINEPELEDIIRTIFVE